ncbi:SMP-30/gluconolactonase/LRE family protein [Kovacikia minuta CCNUW1]|uniref:SMP-30/gluconolactonase/LRE family protein n=1 Tax=Kovacikia minuta TaxID=2931930 RepID=UPI001CCD594F|nr:SMP-30/gluconolactonase/LRE family protein [Kovacikia minuta]UBF24310.1 SMP-30/gluconolactonase/LRE family protein [Kovacikia minuta CCNUW1]
MKRRIPFLIFATLTALALPAVKAIAQVTSDVPAGNPISVINLATSAGTQLIKGQWRYQDARIVQVGFNSPGADRKASGSPNQTYDITPRAGVANFDDSTWKTIAPETLDQRRCTGKLCFNWYRLNLTIPQKVGNFDPTGSDVVFEIVVDDYAEVWVNGQLPLVLGQTGGSLIKGYNAPNRVLIARNVKPGQQFQLAVFGANGPLSNPPGNFIWVRSATLDFYKPSVIGKIQESTGGKIDRLDPALDAIVPQNAKIEKLASGFQFTEGPVWVRDGGYLLFSDPNANTIYRWSSDGQVSIFRTKSGYTGVDIGEYKQPGSNGLTLDQEGRLTINEHGNRRVTRLEKNGVLTVLADRYEGKRLNSPNDLVYRSDRALFFTDPPFGLPNVFDDSRKELPYSGVYCLNNGNLKLLTRELSGPNGIAFSPNEKYLYVGNWDEKYKVVMRYEVKPDCSLSNGRVFYDMTKASGEDAIDGIKVDRQGNLYVSGPGGLWILSPQGKHLGTIIGPEHPHNLAWGDADGKTLYLAAQTSLYRIRLNIPGIRP